jgi:hypothetical protein
MARIFISSTYEDLITHRAVVRDAILTLNHQPVGMESFPATDRDSLEACRAHVQSCDMFIGIYAYRYGTIPTPSGQHRSTDRPKSITELEYEWASQSNMPRYIFVVDPNFYWPQHFREISGSPEEGYLNIFKSKLGAERLYRRFTSEDSLRAAVLESFVAVPPGPPIPIHMIDSLLTTEIAIQWLLYGVSMCGWFVGGQGPLICCLICPYAVLPTSLAGLFFGYNYGAGRARRTIILSAVNGLSMFLPLILMALVSLVLSVIKAIVSLF